MCELTMRASLVEMPGAAEGRAEKDPKSARSGSRWNLTLGRAGGLGQAGPHRDLQAPPSRGSGSARLAGWLAGWLGSCLSLSHRPTNKLVLESLENLKCWLLVF